MTPKSRSLKLPSPELVTQLNSTGKLSFEWSLEYEGVLFNWTRELTGVTLLGKERGFGFWINRRPESNWPVCLFEPGGGGNGNNEGMIQFLDYNYAVSPFPFPSFPPSLSTIT